MTKIPKSLLDGMCIQVEPYIGNIDRDIRCLLAWIKLTPFDNILPVEEDR